MCELIDQGLPTGTLANELTKYESYSYLQASETPYEGVSPTRYSTKVKSGVVMLEMIFSAPRCSICNWLVPAQAVSIDHKDRREDGGLADVGNLQMTHPYCNTGYKEMRQAAAKTASLRTS